MCSFKVLNQNDNGYVVHCRQCGHIQIAFGNVALVLVEPKFNSFKNLIEEHQLDKQYELEREIKNIYLETSSKNISMVFSVNDINNLNELLTEAHLNLQVNKLLQTVNQ